jgi:hypothetical protein
MNKIKLKLHEYYALEAELNGVVNQRTGEVVLRGLLSEKIKLATKYWVNDLAKKVLAEKVEIEKLKEDLIKKHGEQDESGGVSIPVYINIVKNEAGEITSKEINPKYVEFESDFNALLQEEKEIEYKPFKLEEFDSVESESVYNTFFKLIEVQS